jgi:hypothetical protein
LLTTILATANVLTPQNAPSTNIWIIILVNADLTQRVLQLVALQIKSSITLLAAVFVAPLQLASQAGLSTQKLVVANVISITPVLAPRTSTLILAVANASIQTWSLS